MQKLGFK
ncbi:unnamed protein product, partial [Didymodactylos carnosus]